jgi:ubiquinone/menaquinone biosynthesis C-methylase UbiE
VSRLLERPRKRSLAEPQLPDRPSRTAQPGRKVRVTTQYGSPEAAADYARHLDGTSPRGRTQRHRLRLVQETLARHPGGDLLDAGCGPGVMARMLLTTRPADFSITLLDQSAAMIGYCRENVRGVGDVRATVGQLEALPFADASFDVALIMGALEYADARAALRETARILRPGGLLVVTMLNPLSPYRLTEWIVYWPLIRLIGALEERLAGPAGRRHGADHTGIRSFPPGRLRRLLRGVGLLPMDVVHYDITPLIPPLDRLPAVTRWAERIPYERTVGRGWRGWLGTGYLITAKRD